MSSGPPSSGPPVFETQAWPETLTARVVTPGPEPRLAGYDVEGDLAVYYPFTATILLALVGELPSDAAIRAFDVALHFLAPAAVNEAPTHAALLARHCAGPTRSVTGVAAIALAEEAAWVVREHDEWLAWLAAPVVLEPPPDRWRATQPEDVRAARRLSDAVARTGLAVPALAHGPTRTAAIFAVLVACGLRTKAQIESAWVLARLPAVLAEARAAKPGFRDYPFDLPQVMYEEPG
jgi:hypothetical protein